MKKNNMELTSGLNKTRLFVLLGILAFSVVLLVVVKRSDQVSQYLITAPLAPGDVITNQASATFEDTSGTSYGPVTSNTVQTTITGTSGETFSFRHNREARQSSSGSVTIRVYAAGTTNMAATLTASTDNAGNATVNTSGLTNGQSYDFVLKVPYHLTKKLANVQWPPVNVLDFGVILAADLDDNDIVNSLDWSTMNSRWRTSDPVADINQDTIVNTVDWGVMNKNWGVVGEE